MRRLIFLLGSARSMFFESTFLKCFHLIYNCSAFDCVKKFDKCLFIGWSVAVFILLANILIVRLIYSITI